MLKKDLSGGGNPRGNSWARVCDTCQSAPCSVYCRPDAAYLCTACDARIHAAHQLASRHERVWVCEACERAPAAFLCKADAASLCADCDADIHSANPLARRHHRVPILPLSSSTTPGSRNEAAFPMAEDGFDDEDEDEAASWLLLNQPTTKDSKNNNTDDGNNTNNNNPNGCYLGGEVDEYLDLVEYTSGGDNCQISDDNYGHQYDSVVPVGIGEAKLDGHDHHNFYDIKLGYDYNTASISHSVSLDAGVVPESSSMMSDISTSQQRPPKGTIDLFSGAPAQQTPTQLSPMDREARVMRYREKKKTRKFEKTIRYASRKAYAETRPRIKGRFAKRTDVEVEEMFPSSIMGDGGYGIVPSF